MSSPTAAEDATVSDNAMATNRGKIKTGSPRGSDCLTKFVF